VVRLLLHKSIEQYGPRPTLLTFTFREGRLAKDLKLDKKTGQLAKILTSVWRKNVVLSLKKTGQFVKKSLRMSVWWNNVVVSFTSTWKTISFLASDPPRPTTMLGGSCCCCCC
jgi:hypothetical protein